MKQVNGTAQQAQLNVSDWQLDKMISMSETELTHLLEIQQPLSVQMKEAEELFVSAKKEFDAVNDKVNEVKGFLEQLGLMKQNKKSGEHIRVMRATSHI